MPFAYLNKSVIVLKEEGLHALLSRMKRKILKRIFTTRYSIWFVKDLNEPAEPLQGEYEDFTLCFDRFDEITAWLKRNKTQYPWLYSEKEIAFARQYHHLFPFLKHKDEIVCYTKVALYKVYIRDYDSLFSLAPGTAMFYGTTTLPDYRKKGLPRLLKQEIFTHLKKLGIKKVYAHIEPWNIPSIKSNTGVGFRELFRNRFIKILWFRFHTHNPQKHVGADHK